MTKTITLGMASLALVFAFAAATPAVHAAALPEWDANGNWNVAFDYLGTPYTHDMLLNQDSSGALTGSGGYPASGPYTYAWVIDTGTMSGNEVHLDTHYTAGAVCTMTIDGVVATTTGAMSGTWSDDCSGARSGTWTTTNGTATVILIAPTPLSPANGYSTTTAGLSMIDWTDVTDPFLPMTYIYQSSNSPSTNPDGSFVTPVYTSGPLSVSEIATAGTPEGTWYWHVKAVDSASNSSAWSTTWSVIVDNTPVVAPITPLNKDQCKNDGWKTFTAPSFRNQGQCVSWTNHNL